MRLVDEGNVRKVRAELLGVLLAAEAMVTAAQRMQNGVARGRAPTESTRREHGGATAHLRKALTAWEAL